MRYLPRAVDEHDLGAAFKPQERQFLFQRVGNFG